MKKTLLMLLVLVICAGCISASAEQAVQPGDLITFGTYPQTTKGSDATPIEWMVLQVEEGRALLVSRCLLDRKSYNNSYKAVTWETCSLRAWLNGDFMNKAFTADEQALILLTSIETPDTDWRAVYEDEQYAWWSSHDDSEQPVTLTEDRIFLLSEEEAVLYFPSREDRLCAPTPWAVTRGCFASDAYKADDRGAGMWWCRNAGEVAENAACVYANGRRDFADVRAGDFGVRPAMWVSIDALAK